MLDLTIKADLPYSRDGDWSVGPIYDGGSEPRTALMHAKDGPWMVDCPAEIETQREGVEQAHARGGHVLTTGLGLCQFPRLCLRSPNVVKVTVIELNEAVIRQVAPKWLKEFGSRLEVIQADAYQWTPPAGARYSVGWHDPFLFAAHVWPENAKDAARLIQRYAPFCDWQGWWKGDPELKAYGGSKECRF